MEYLIPMLRVRQARLLTKEQLELITDAASFDDAAVTLVDCGYPDMSGFDTARARDVLENRRRKIFAELSASGSARELVLLFMLKYDYNNVKTLVKARAVNAPAGRLLSDSGRVASRELVRAFDSGKRMFLPEMVARAMYEAESVLSKTASTYLCELAADKAYFAEFYALAESIGDCFVVDYAKLFIDSVNLRTAVRCQRRGCDKAFLRRALIPGGNAEIFRIVSAGSIAEIFSAHSALKLAAVLGAQTLESGGPLTPFERACEDAVLGFVSDAAVTSSGSAVVIAYLSAMEKEIAGIGRILAAMDNEYNLNPFNRILKRND